eukprot:Awhi_evm1s8777
MFPCVKVSTKEMKTLDDASDEIIHSKFLAQLSLSRTYSDEYHELSGCTSFSSDRAFLRFRSQPVTACFSSAS